mmetsp:Transcript_23718/g.69432  ORF Transcript_23718/g.69432 Transcript_23718/m.69432 type:complete len:227 (-) Transcript_23718:26-706(-)
MYHRIRGNRDPVPEAVILNVYDMSPANQALRVAGLGLYHSGVEIYGMEFTFAGGAGVFHHTPRQPPGDVVFCEQIQIGATTRTMGDVRRLCRDLMAQYFGPEDYHLLNNNCNHFAQALVRELVGTDIPGRINRLASVGSTCGHCVAGIVGPGAYSVTGTAMDDTSPQPPVTQQPGAEAAGFGGGGPVVTSTSPLQPAAASHPSLQPLTPVDLRKARLARFEPEPGR